MGDQRQEGYALRGLGAGYAAQGNRTRAGAAFEQALICFHTVGDRRGEAECRRHYGLALARQDEGQRALPLLRAAVAYEQEIGYAQIP
jgi:tetratricopeptide (TPR) repeat protein